MSKVKYSPEQVQELESNKYVASATSKYITFTDSFKLLAIEQDSLWIYHRDIFRSSGFPDYIVDWDIPKRSLWRWRRWRRQIRQWWEEALIWKKKGRPKVERTDTSKMNKDEYILYLEAKLALSEALEKWEEWEYP